MCNLLQHYHFLRSFPMHFDEKSMFAGDKKGAKSLKVKSSWLGHMGLGAACWLCFNAVHLNYFLSRFSSLSKLFWLDFTANGTKSLFHISFSVPIDQLLSESLVVSMSYNTFINVFLKDTSWGKVFFI